MPKQTHATVSAPPATEEAVAPLPAPSSEDLKRKMDELLDDIDQVLEENAEAFVNSYVQRGGE